MNECDQKIIVILTPDQDGVNEERAILLGCCLTAPHTGWKHQNPRIQRTVGGERRTTSKEWSFYIERTS